MNDRIDPPSGRDGRDRRDWREPVRVEGPGGPTPVTTNLVVGFDRHNAAQVALGFAIGLAARLHAHLHVVHVIDLDDLPIDPDADDWEQAVAAAVDDERANACAMLARSTGDWTYHTRHGNPAQVLSSVAEASDAAVILLGAPRRGLVPLVERLLGESVSARLIQHSHRPVLLVPEQLPPSLAG